VQRRLAQLIREDQFFTEQEKSVFGRLGAEGLRGMCAYVSPESARPGDLIFFEKTYDTTGASHVGIYVGNNRMLHCGDPIHYASIDTSYWRSHFPQFGRLP